MSLLIKALHQAEQKKASEDKLTASAGEAALALEPRDGELEAEAGLAAAAAMHAPVDVDASPSARRAASVIFSAKRRGEHTSTYILIAAGVLLLMIVAGVFYYYLESLRTPEVVVPPPPVPPALVTATRTTSPAAAADESSADHETAPAAPIFEDEPPAQDISAKDVSVQDENLLDRVIELEQKVAQEQAAPAARQTTTPAPAVADSGVQVTRHTPPPAVDPRLEAAYHAFVAGDDATAQAAYRQVLQTDVRNTDALLGMGAVALRQGRDEDAAGWYNAVLEVDPRNSFAQAALASLFGELDPVRAESRIKNLIARQPEAAHLYAALGNLYAEQKQWPQAQQAYFEAYRLAADNADYAFNLAVSLDQMGKPALALQYYEQALSLLEGSDTAGIGRTVLEARIRQLQ